jgi:hypothetical protein
MSSYENKSGTNARWYHDADGKGRCVTMLAYRSDNDINTWDDDEHGTNAHWYLTCFHMTT